MLNFRKHYITEVELMKEEKTHGTALTPEQAEQLAGFIVAIERMAEELRLERAAGKVELPKTIDPQAYYARKLSILDDIIANVKKLQQATTPEEKAELDAEVLRLLQSGGFYTPYK